jgi:predicted helicase
MAANQREVLRNVKTLPQLVAYLRDELEWPIDHDDMDDIDDLIFDVNPTDLGLKPDVVAKIDYVKRFRPLDHNQPWAIYFVKFAPNNLPVAALRRILNRLSVRQRGGVTNQTSNIWQPDDLLFISQYGEDSDRRITFAHFLNTPGKKDLPTLKVLGWDGDDTNLTLDAVAKTLRTKLCWPSNTNDIDHWKKKWRSAFQLGHREQITSSKLMADKLAFVARSVRTRIQGALAVENESGPLHILMKSFKESLISDLTEASFADMFAQTISYGLLSARIANGSAQTADELASAMPITSPFLKELMAQFLDISGRKTGTTDGLDYDELGISEVVDLLDQANMEAVLLDFGNKNKDEDPVMHFFEGFLQAYDIQIKHDRGVFYTPKPVVSYIVRSVHELLQTEFGLEDGLADTSTWGEMLKKHPKMKLPLLTDVPGEKRTISPDIPFVQILDPATGTATFLVEVIDVIYKTLTAKWSKERKSVTEQDFAWNDYVPKHLLPRLHAYELMMAPYAIAHMKVGLKLKETGYQFASEGRAQIYLTNALEPWLDQLPLIGFDALAHEAESVNEIKRFKRFTVIIGNPPYASLSLNMDPWIRDQTNAYLLIEGARIEEKSKRNHLQNDYIKFIRLADLLCQSATFGIFSYITSNSYLDGRTLRGLRWNLLNRYHNLTILNLYGDSNKGDAPPNDANVFDITEGVSILLACHAPKPSQPQLSYSELQGPREYKYRKLEDLEFGLSRKVIQAQAPHYLFRDIDSSISNEFTKIGPALNQIYGVSGAGMKSNRDDFVTGENRSALLDRMRNFADRSISDSDIRSKYGLKDNYVWKLPKARADFQTRTVHEHMIAPLTYRPFSDRYVYYDKAVVFNPRFQIMNHMLSGDNLSIVSIGQNESKVFNHAFVSRSLVEIKMATHYGASVVFPIYLRTSDFGLLDCSMKSNLTSVGSPLIEIASYVVSDDTPNELRVAHYIYAILYSPEYRARYAEPLMSDFPRVPIRPNLELFSKLSWLGCELSALHLMESRHLDFPKTSLVGDYNPIVDKVSWRCDTVWLNKSETSGFRGISEAVWNFHIGGYQVCEKWLKDRKGRTLTVEDIAHYHKIVVALSETIRIMKEIDEVIEQHGGWPGAFQTSGDSSSAPIEYKYDERTPKAAEGTLFED